MRLTRKDIETTFQNSQYLNWQAGFCKNLLETVDYYEAVLKECQDRNVALVEIEAKLRNHLHTRLGESADEVRLLGAELEKLKAELIRLRPPTPKFRVGQVVRNGLESFIQITGCHNSSVGLWYDHKGGCTHENNLRALTDDEK
jgi:hypothetical protein